MIIQLKNLIFILLTLLMTPPQTFSQESYYYPEEEWEYIEIDSPCSYLRTIESFVIDSLNTTGLLIIKNGKIAFEYGDTKELSYIASARKSMLSLLYGNYVANGVINLDATLQEMDINDKTSLTETEKNATIDQILNARSGVYLPAANAGSGPFRPERGEHLPGTYFYYNNWDFNVAGTLFEKLTGKNIYNAFEDDIAKPIGMQDYLLTEQKKYGDSTISYHPAYHFYLSTRDMARVGYLVLRNGKWKEKQIVPESWISKATTKVSDTNDPILPGYSYMWWLYDGENHPELKGAFTAFGAYGQFITIIPELDIVIAHKTKSKYQRRTKLDDYDKLVKKIVIGEREKTTTISYDLNEYVGKYKELNEDEKAFGFDIELKNQELKLKGTLFPYEIPLSICNQNTAILHESKLGNPQIFFTRDSKKAINGIYIPGPGMKLTKIVTE